jgi:hypothetical protein
MDESKQGGLCKYQISGAEFLDKLMIYEYPQFTKFLVKLEIRDYEGVLLNRETSSNV